MKTHLNLATTDLRKSVSFYSTLLNTRPAIVFADYALFVTNEPALELALDVRESVNPESDAHYGIFVETVLGVEATIARLNSAGLADSIECEDDCCYARQTKMWATDPEGRRWEVYAVHEDTHERDNEDAQCCVSEAGALLN